jgi:hypothetical protein
LCNSGSLSLCSAQKESTQRNAPPAVAKDATQGSQFNKFFPKGSGGFQTVAAQEKKGFAEYKLKQGGKDVAVLSINDTISTLQPQLNSTAALKNRWVSSS